MTARRKYPLPDLKILYGLAAGRCAFPRCRREVVLEDSIEEGRKQIGKIGHIVGHSDQGPRGDQDYPQGKLDTYENWILLCPTCHDTVDTVESRYTVAYLRTLKEEHELWVRTSLGTEMPGIGFQELEVVAWAIATSANAPSEDFSVTSPQEKMERNELTKPVQMLLTMGLSKAKEVHSFIQQFAVSDSEFPERLKAGFAAEYQRLRANGMSGDALFEALHQFSSSGSREFKRQAAGLAILAYLFELCEVFEK